MLNLEAYKFNQQRDAYQIIKILEDLVVLLKFF